HHPTHDVSKRRKRLQKTERLGTRKDGHHFRNECDACSEFTADTQTCEESEDAELRDILSDAAESCEDGIDHDRERHGLGATPTASASAEDQTAGCPSENEKGGRPASRRSLLFKARIGEKFANGDGARVGEDLLVHRIEEPAHSGQRENVPMVSVQ